MSEISVKLTSISKKYMLHHERPTLVENIIGRGRDEVFWALRNINLKIEKGDTLGIIGPNGSGKTTLLEIIAGITSPTEGEIVIKGKVISLIDLGAGFHSDLTGEENIFFNGQIIGLTRKETRKKFKKIVDFADIGGFIDTPLYTYSDGMRLRLGFAVAVHSEPDILILDENIAVGDADFRQKSQEKIKDFIKQGKTLIIASHSFDLLRELVQRIVWLDKGRLRDDGKVNLILGKVEKIYS